MLAWSNLGEVLGLGHHPHLGSYQGQVGHRGCQEELKEGLGTAEVARLADPQLYQPRQAVFHDLAPAPVFAKCGAFLEGPGLLQEGFLGMESHSSPPALSRRHALRPQGAYDTDLRVELKTLGLVGPAQPVGPGAHGPQGVGNITGWTGAGSCRQVDPEVFLGEAGLIRATRHLGY